jgi:hypothetical protein
MQGGPLKKGMRRTSFTLVLHLRVEGCDLLELLHVLALLRRLLRLHGVSALLFAHGFESLLL